jgi:hypothetical protein
MPNYCDYSMRIKGSKDSIQRVVDCLKADYNYGEGQPAHKHFFRVFDVYEGDMEDNGDGTYTLSVSGYCAWSVASCMCDGKWSYYDSVKEDYPDIFMGTTLQEQSQDCEIEVFSEEEGMCFSEHFIFKNGECLCEETEEIESGGYNEEGEPTTDIDWENYDGETLVFNPYRLDRTEDFCWSF